jgi:hypothetical protein
MVMPVNVNIGDLIAMIYPNPRRNVGNVQYLNQYAVLCLTNKTFDEVNNHIMSP